MPPAPQDLVKLPFANSANSQQHLSLWQQCQSRLQAELPAQQYNTWILPLSVNSEAATSQAGLELLAPNRFIRDWVREKHLDQIRALIAKDCDAEISVSIESPDAQVSMATEEGFAGVKALEPSRHISTSATTGIAADSRTSEGDTAQPNAIADPASLSSAITATDDVGSRRRQNAAALPPSLVEPGDLQHDILLCDQYGFDNFVEGRSNQLAIAAARQVAENPGGAYNPLFVYGGVGLGKTHLMHAVGNALRTAKPDAKIIYLHSESFVTDMVKALKLNAITDFKRYYRTADVLLIDDIQFFEGKERSQEEFFHTFNALLERGGQMIFSSDRYPKDIDGLEERLRSRFSWGLTVAVEPPELETRVAILMQKAEASNVTLPPEAAFFIAQRVRSNVRELEGTLKRVFASANFHGRPVDMEIVRESLKDLMASQDKQVTLDNIQRKVAEYYQIKVADLLSRRRNRSIARPRQLAMALAKELTNHSLPEIGDGFQGRDHTTVLHACRKIQELRDLDSGIQEDYKNLIRTLTN